MESKNLNFKKYIKLVLETSQEIDVFANQVLKAIDKALTSKFFRTSGRFFGNSRIFISTAFSVFSQMFPNAYGANDENLFKNMLVQANKEGKLRLVRADLVAAMDQEIVNDSETTYLGAAFHLIEVPQELLKKHGLKDYE